MSSKLIYDKNGWLFENPQENIVHDITIDDINQLLNCAEQDEMWAATVKTEVTNRDEAIKNGMLRLIDKAINWNFIYDLVEEKYCPDNGRPSMDPVMLIKIPFSISMG